MCGIAGIVGAACDNRGAVLDRMSAAIAHRGPDGVGKWQDEQVMLGHRRLSILDLTNAGHQPMVSHCGRYVMTYNGELYNYLEIRADLEARGVVFRSSCDSEVFLADYASNGANCLQRFNGMWACAIWDRERKTLFACRDRFGKKPFYFVICKEYLLFASEIKAILASDLVARRANPMAVADFCAERATDHTEETFFQGVRQLPPAGWLEWNGGNIQTGRFWALPGDGEELHSSDAAANARRILESATKLRLRADTPVGVLLSGGIDSSAVTCLAARFSPSTIHAFSTVDTERVEEAKGIDQVLASHPNVTVHYDTPDASCLAEELDRCVWHQEEPFADGSMLAHFRLMRLAREKGVKVLLTGQGADEVFAGYPGYLQVHLSGLIANRRWEEAYQFARQVTFSGQPLSKLGVIGQSLPPTVSARVRARRSRHSVDWLVEEYARVSPDIANGYARAPGADPVNRALRESIEKRTLPGFLHYEDRNSMAFGVETRLPYLDYRIASEILPIPGRVKLRGGLPKALLRDATRGTVPPSILRRVEKQGYPAPLGRWLRESSADSKGRWLESIASCPLIKFRSWRKRYERFMAGDDRELTATWRGLVLSLWHQRFIDSRG